MEKSLKILTALTLVVWLVIGLVILGGFVLGRRGETALCSLFGSCASLSDEPFQLHLEDELLEKEDLPLPEFEGEEKLGEENEIMLEEEAVGVEDSEGKELPDVKIIR